MSQQHEITVTPEIGFGDQLIPFIKDKFSVQEDQTIQILKRSVDSRSRTIKVIIRLQIVDGKIEQPTFNFQSVGKSDQEVHIIGAGPAGLFAGLKALELGVKPIIFERGKMVKERRRDLAMITKEHKVNPESNYCFGEGGAGTYSDGKLYTRSKKRGDVQDVLNKLIHFGATEEIGYDAHPHVGTNKLPQIIEEIRDLIIEKGGEIRFNSKLTDLKLHKDQISEIQINDDKWISTKNVILATGHSARDIYYLLHKREIEIEFKPFALGVRIEHQQKLIDKIQYKLEDRGEFLPASSYRLVAQANGRGVYSFCMCPGGIIAPCATDNEEVVTNGWSPSKRNNATANSGIVTEVKLTDLEEFQEYGALAGLEFQKMVEKTCWEAAGKTQKVPAQRMEDFINNRKSKSLPESSYHAGITICNLNDVLPKFVSSAIRLGLEQFGKKLQGFKTNEAVLHAPESRTSSPVRIPREKELLHHVRINNLYPCAEGAGYAGGIVSAAIDGMRCVQEIVKKSEL